MHTVKEDLEDSDEYIDEEDDATQKDPNLNPHKFVRSKGEFQDFVQDLIESNVIKSLIKQFFLQKIQKVQAFLLMIVMRKRYLKMK